MLVKDKHSSLFAQRFSNGDFFYKINTWFQRFKVFWV